MNPPKIIFITNAQSFASNEIIIIHKKYSVNTFWKIFILFILLLNIGLINASIDDIFNMQISLSAL